METLKMHETFQSPPPVFGTGTIEVTFLVTSRPLDHVSCTLKYKAVTSGRWLSLKVAFRISSYCVGCLFILLNVTFEILA